MEPYQYFAEFQSITKRRYDALRAYFYDKKKAKDVAQIYGFTTFAFYSLIRDFKKYLKENPHEDYFFKGTQLGRKQKVNIDGLDDLIIQLRKQNHSTEDILIIVQSKGYKTSYGYIYKVLHKEGFARLLRRSKSEKEKLTIAKIKAPISEPLRHEVERFETKSTGILCFLPYIKKYQIDTAIINSTYPETNTINRLSSILSFLALKLSNIRRYSVDDLWCMDRGLGLFAVLNVLPKSGWFTSYSDRVIQDMNLSFLRCLHTIWQEHKLLSDTCNLDFTTIPYWGESCHLENNWSGKRNEALSSMLSVLAQDPDSGIIDYGTSNVMHKNESSVVLEYLDFYRYRSGELKYLIFDNKFTNYENLSKLDDQGIKFITIRRRGCRILDHIHSIPSNQWKTKRIETAELKKRTLKVYEEIINLKGYCDFKNGQPKNIRQILITGHGKIKPAIMITNDFNLEVDQIVRKYCRRWLVEKGISEQVEFFHLNRVSSSMVIKVDFDLSMSILAHNLYRVFAQDLYRYMHFSDIRIYEKFIDNGGIIKIKHEKIIIEMKKKRDLPQILDMMKQFNHYKFDWLGNKTIEFIGASTS